MKYSYVCWNTIFSKLFEIAGNSDLGRQLSNKCESPFLKRGMTLAISNFSGKIPVHKDWFIISDNVLTANSSMRFRNFVENESWPQLFFDARSFIIFCTVETTVHSKLKDEIILCFKYESIFFPFCGWMIFANLVPTLAKNSLKWFEISYCFSRSSVKFQGHTALKIAEFYPDWAFPDCNSSLNSPMAKKWCTKLEVALKRCPIVFQGHPSNFKVTLLKNRRIWPKLGVSGL